MVDDNFLNTGNHAADQFSPPIPHDSTPTATPTATPSGTPSGTPTDTPTTTPTATPSSTADSQPVGQTGGAWKLIFHDEFNGSGAPNPQVWATCYSNFSLGSQDCYHDQDEQEAYTPQNVTEANGALTLTAKQQTVAQFPYTSGMISSGPSQSRSTSGFSFTYGYAEMRVQIPVGQGLWPAFWLLPANGDYPPEIDVFEILGNAPNVVNMHYHYPDGSSEGSDSGGEWSGPDFSAGWHTFAINWEPGSLTWYVDGVARRTYANSNVSSQAMYIIANLAVGGQSSWPGAPDGTTRFPATMQIDYIRVWQH
jgi:beta-glucanase (GH16 family)